MRITSKLLLLAILVSPLLTYAGEMQRINLIDGSTLHAEVVSMSNGVYQLRTESIGIIVLEKDKIRSIENLTAQNTAPTAPAPPPAATSNDQHKMQITEIQKNFAQDPASMKQIEALKNDPAMQRVLGDENTMRAIHAGDLNALMNDPNIKALMNNATIQELTGSTGP